MQQQIPTPLPAIARAATCAQAGAYVKEFVNGDWGRCQPCLGDLLAQLQAEEEAEVEAAAGGDGGSAAGGSALGAGAAVAAAPPAAAMVHVEIVQLDVLEVHLEDWPPRAPAGGKLRGQ